MLGKILSPQIGRLRPLTYQYIMRAHESSHNTEKINMCASQAKRFVCRGGGTSFNVLEDIKAVRRIGVENANQRQLSHHKHKEEVHISISTLHFNIKNQKTDNTVFFHLLVADNFR